MLSAIISQTSVGLSVVNREGNSTFANERYCEIVGRTLDDLLKISMSLITHTDDLQANLKLFERAIDVGESFEIKKRYVRPDGTFVSVHDSVSVLHDAAGQHFGVLTVTLDLAKMIA